MGRRVPGVWASLARAGRAARGALGPERRSFAKETQRLSLILQDATDTPLAARALVSAVTRGVSAQRVVLFLRSPPQDEFVVAATEGQDDPVTLALQGTNPVIAWLEGQSRAVVGGEITSLPQWHALSHTEQEALSALDCELLVPMRARGVLVAILVMGRRTGGRPYTREETEWIQLVAHQTGASMEAIRLHNQLIQQREEVGRVKEQLARSTRSAAIGDAASALAREINNPLQSILNVAHLMGRDADEGGVSREDIDTVRAEAARACNAVTALLDLASDDKGVWGMHDLNALLLSMVADSGLSASTSGVVPVLQLDRGVSHVWCDEQQLKRVFLNLIGNALGAMPQGGRLTISTQVTPGNVEIGFTDTGIGIPADSLERVFDPFFTTKPERSGTGLGLSASRQAVELHRGTIGIESQVGKGTAVTVSLPLQPIDQDGNP